MAESKIFKDAKRIVSDMGLSTVAQAIEKIELNIVNVKIRITREQNIINGKLPGHPQASNRLKVSKQILKEYERKVKILKASKKEFNKLESEKKSKQKKALNQILGIGVSAPTSNITPDIKGKLKVVIGIFAAIILVFIMMKIFRK